MPNPNGEQEKLRKALEASRAIEKSAEDAEYHRFQQQKLAEKLGLNPNATTEEIDEVIKKRGLTRETLEKGAIPDPEEDNISIENEGAKSPDTSKSGADFLVNNIPPSDKSVDDIIGKEKLEKPDFAPEKDEGKPKKGNEDPTVDIDILGNKSPVRGEKSDIVKEELEKKPEDKTEDASGTEFETNERVILGSKKLAKSPNEILRKEGVETVPGSKGYKPGESPVVEDELNKPVTPEGGKKLPEGQKQSTLGEFLTPEQRKEGLAKKVEGGRAIKEPTGEKPETKTPEGKLEGELSEEVRKAISEQLKQFPNKEALRNNFNEVIREITGEEQITLYEFYKRLERGEELDIPESLLNPEKAKGKEEGEELVPWPESPERKTKEGKETAGEKPATEQKPAIKSAEQPARREVPRATVPAKEISISDVWAERAKRASQYSDWLDSGIDTQIETFKNVADTSRNEYYKSMRRMHIDHIKWLKNELTIAKRKGDKNLQRQLEARIKQERKSFREFTKGSLNEGLVKRRWLLNPFRRMNWWFKRRKPMTNAEERIGAQIEQELAGQPSSPEVAVMNPKVFFARGLSSDPLVFFDAFVRDQAKSLGIPNVADIGTNDLTRQVSDVLEETEKAKAAAEGAGAPKGPEQTPNITT